MNGRNLHATLALLFFSCPAAAGEFTPAEIVGQLDAAYNDHDVDAMLQLYSDDVRWMSLAGAEITTEAKGLDEIEAAMQAYFKSQPSTRSSHHGVNVSGPFVTAVEEVTWQVGEEQRKQCATSVYEVRDQKIQNVWYFASFPCPEMVTE